MSNYPAGVDDNTIDGLYDAPEWMEDYEAIREYSLPEAQTVEEAMENMQWVLELLEIEFEAFKMHHGGE